MADFILDFGNARIKAYDPRTRTFLDYRHAVAEITQHEWKRAVGRGAPPVGFCKVNGVPYVVGDMALRHQIKDRPQGAARYTPDYYGVVLAFMMGEVLQKSAKRVTLFGSHAPVDVAHTPDMVRASQGTWMIESRTGKHAIDITHVETFDEPLGGYAHFAFTERGFEKKNNPLVGGNALVIDVGGFTVDYAIVDRTGNIMPLDLDSKRTGTIQLVEDFERELRDKYAEDFRESPVDIDVRKLEDALLSGWFKFGKEQLDVRYEADAALNALTNEVKTIIQRAGGVANFETILLTGGGPVLIYDRLVQAMPKANFALAEPERDLMRFANVFGGAKIAAVLRNTGVL